MIINQLVAVQRLELERVRRPSTAGASPPPQKYGGEREQIAAQARRRNGIPVGKAVAAELEELGGRYGIKLEYADAGA